MRPETVIKTGSPMYEVLNHYKPQIEASGMLKQLRLKPREYFVVSAHREENVDNPANLADLLDSLDQATRKFKKRAIVSTHPRTRNRLAALKGKKLPSAVEFLKPLGYFDYMKLQTNAYCVLVGQRNADGRVVDSGVSRDHDSSGP